MLRKILLIGNSDEFQYSMKLFPEMILRLLRERGVEVELIRPRTVFGRLAPWAGRLGKWLFYIDKFLIFPLALRAKLRRDNAPGLVAHITDHSNGMYVPRLARVPHLITCHDLMPMRSALGEVPQNPTSWTGKCFQRLILNGIRKARFVVCVSSATKADLLRIAGTPEDRTRVIFNALHYPYAPMPEAEARARVKALTGVEGPYLLHVGGDAWYKNRAGVVAIYAELRQRLREEGRPVLPKLIYAGPPLQRELHAFVDRDPEMKADVIGIQGADNESLRALYSAAEALVFPSWDEGFGWPIIEAQACGCRVVTTGKAPMTEVGGEAAYYVDPGDPRSAGGVLWELLHQGEEERRAAIERGRTNAARFSQERMISEYIEVYQRLTGEAGA